MNTKIESDLKAIAEFDISLWDNLRNKRIFATGCTGFIGAWFIHSFLYINHYLKLNASLCLLTRNKEKLFEKYDFLKSEKSVEVLEGDIQDFLFPETDYDFVIHGATEVSAFQSGKNPSHLIDVSYLGTKRIIEFCKERSAQRVLFLSSGAVYGPMSLEENGYQEDFNSAPQTNSKQSSYGEAKRLSEMLLFNETNFQTISARIFAACGPFLPMDSSFAFSNFLKNCLEQKDIVIKSNGKSTRSYLYASDLILWLWTLLLKGSPGEVYNIGSSEEISIEGLARVMAEVLNTKSQVIVQGTENNFTRYFPLNRKIREEFSLPSPKPLKEAIICSFKFHQGSK